MQSSKLKYYFAYWATAGLRYLIFWNIFEIFWNIFYILLCILSHCWGESARLGSLSAQGWTLCNYYLLLLIINYYSYYWRLYSMCEFFSLSLFLLLFVLWTLYNCNCHCENFDDENQDRNCHCWFWQRKPGSYVGADFLA